jgi:hypothetical protein
MKRTIFFVYAVLIVATTTQAQNFVGLHNGYKHEYKNLVLIKPGFSSRYLLADDSIKYRLSEVKYYQIQDGYFLKRGNRGTEFMKREQEGIIELFGVVRTTHSFDPNTGIPTSSSSKINFYRKNNGRVKKVNSKNLRMDVSDCESCLKEIKKAKTLGVISAIGLTAGLGIFIGTAATHLSETPEPGEESSSIPAGAIIGPALCFTPLILSGSKRSHFENAISLYNNRK